MSKDKTIRVRVVTYYGRVTAYPICDNAKTFAKIAGTKTLTKKALELARDLGFEIEVVQETPDIGEIA